jgi:hypothetical protein
MMMRNSQNSQNSTHRCPQSVDEAAERLISDLLIQHLNALAHMTDEEFNTLCDHVAPFLLDEFEIWQGNDALLESCFRNGDSDSVDPAQVILKRVKQLLSEFNGYLVIP